MYDPLPSVRQQRSRVGPRQVDQAEIHIPAAGGNFEESERARLELTRLIAGQVGVIFDDLVLISP